MIMEKLIHYKIIIRGTVQGVGFRWSAVREARTLGITGFVRNMSDGSVYIEAEGTTDKMNLFLTWCRRGPAYSSVEDVETTRGEPANFTEFTIER
jgi:acylphosphatase